jgi:hypothetical protein
MGPVQPAETAESVSLGLSKGIKQVPQGRQNPARGVNPGSAERREPVPEGRQTALPTCTRLLRNHYHE